MSTNTLKDYLAIATEAKNQADTATAEKKKATDILLAWAKGTTTHMEDLNAFYEANGWGYKYEIAPGKLIVVKGEKAPNVMRTRRNEIKQAVEKGIDFNEYDKWSDVLDDMKETDPLAELLRELAKEAKKAHKDGKKNIISHINATLNNIKSL